MLARFDCDLSLDLHDPEMKESDIFNHPEIYFELGVILEQHDCLESAIACYQNALDLNPQELKYSKYLQQALLKDKG